MVGLPKILHNDEPSLRQLHRAGLGITGSLRQIGVALEFESPARIGDIMIIGRCSIGAYTYAGPGSEIRNAEIGRFCAIAANAGIGPAEHPMDWLSCHPFQYDGVRYFDEDPSWGRFASNKVRFRKNAAVTHIGHDVWIGRNVIIRQGVNIGTGAVIAGGAFVNRDVEPYTIVAGVPAKPIRKRFPDELIARLLASQWWNWQLDSKKNDFDFTAPEKFLEKFEALMAEEALEPYVPTKYRVTRKGGTDFEFEQLRVEPVAARAVTER